MGVIAAAVAEATVLAPSAGRSSESTMLDKAKGLPPDAVKLKRGQGLQRQEREYMAKRQASQGPLGCGRSKGTKGQRGDF